MTDVVSAQNTNPGQPNPDLGSGPGGQPQQRRDQDGTVWVNTDIITVMADSQLPMMYFWYTSDENGTHAKFRASFLTLIEFEDLNADGAYQSNELLYFAPLTAYDWTLTTGAVKDGDSTVQIWLKYTKGGSRAGGPMPGSPMNGMNGSGSVERFEGVTLQIWAHIYLSDYHGNVTDDHGVKANYTVAGGAELKMDLEIGNFPFSSPTSSIAIQTMLRENDAAGDHNLYRYRFQTRERTRNVSMTSDMNWGQYGGNESTFDNMNSTSVQCINFMDDVSNFARGFFRWVNKAVISWPGGATDAVDVDVSYAPVGMGLAVYLAYPNFDNGTLVHDPSIGLYEGAAPPPNPPVYVSLALGIGAVAAVAVAAVLLRRRHQ